MIAHISDIAAGMKFAALTVLSLVATLATWTWTLVADVQAGADAMTFLPGGAVAISSGALVWVVRQFANGKLLHTDHAANMDAMADAVKRSARAAEQSNEIAEKALDREDLLRQLLLDKN